MKILSDYSLNELYVMLAKYKKFRAKQIFDAIIQSKDYEETNLPKSMIDSLKSEYILKPISIYKVLTSKDGTKKYLLRLHDNNLVECVFLKQNYGNTICLSTQVGCRMGCKFCASTQNGLIRNLSAGEMLSSISIVNADNGKCTDRNFTNIVLMGSGEPFDNYDNVMNFLATVNDDRGLAIGARHITISTCGVVPKIYAFAKAHTQYNLAISLHAPNDALRDTLMPINRAYPLNELMKAVRCYGEENNRRLTFEYILLKGVNDQPQHAKQLAELLKGVHAYVNLIPYNAVDEHGYQGVSRNEAMRFYDALMKMGVRCTIRKEHGGDIDAACGHLPAKHMKVQGVKQ